MNDHSRSEGTSARGRSVESPTLLARTDELWVFDKPSGFAVHQASRPDIPDLVTWAREVRGAPEGLAPIHRLDRETSGVVLCSPDPDLRAQIGGWFALGEVRKIYRAVVHGRTHTKGVIRRPLKDARRKGSLTAVTRYRRLAQLGGFAHLELRPETGRRHQLRRHLAGIGHHIVGDRRYSPRRLIRVPAFPHRLWLHALSLQLPDGRIFESPLPAALTDHLEVLQRGVKARSLPGRERQ